MIIGIDIDDTITDTYEVLVNYSQEYMINVLKKEPIMKHGSCDEAYYTRYLYGWNNNEDIEFLKEYYEIVMKEVKPKTLAVEYLQKLHNEGHKIVLITARWKAKEFDIREITKRWIEEHNIPYDKLIVNAKEKLQFCIDNGIQIFIEDSYETCEQLEENGIKTFLMTTKMNENIDAGSIERVKDWDEIYEKIEKEILK